MANTVVHPTRTILLAGMLLLLQACASPVPRDWPAELPPREYFERLWVEDEANRQYQPQDEYLLWVGRFYQGFNLVPGWQHMVAQVLERVPESEHAALRQRLAELGRVIGGEWARSNKVRRLDTRCAAIWRDALLEALSRDELDAYLTRLEQDVQALLSGELVADDIYFERYYVDEFDF